jgi:serine/threonine-protein kinase
MPARITLCVTRGKLLGKEFTFEDRTTCLIGRSPDCQVQLPSDDDHRLVSRHHCLLDINPPDVRIRDFGSRNGTYVNGTMIGRRAAHQGAEEGARLVFPEKDLKDGDEIELGKTVFRLAVVLPTLCAWCGAEVADEDRSTAESGAGVRCRACQNMDGPTRTFTPSSQTVTVCSQCGRDVSGEAAAGRRGDYVCEACKQDPLQLVERLLAGAGAASTPVAIEGYEILRELGRGGMGAVYLARQVQTGEQVAIKVMLPRVAADERATQLFLREVENTRLLSHPNIVQVRGHGNSGGAFFFLLDYCDGGTVTQLVRDRDGRLSPEEAVPIALQALAGLEHGHAVVVPNARRADGQPAVGGILHRDLKPSNILLCGSGPGRVAKIADYGLGKAFDQAGLSGLTQTGQVSGTPAFMPRQQVINFKYAKPEVDVWALAATLYFMLTGVPPRDFPDDEDRFRIVLETPAVPIRRRNSDLPARLAEVIDEALLDKPAIPFKTAAVFRQHLEAAL